MRCTRGTSGDAMTLAEFRALLDDDTLFRQDPQIDANAVNCDAAGTLFDASLARGAAPSLRPPVHQMPVLP